MSKYILIVDDNPNDLTLSSLQIEKAGFIPILAQDAFTALDQIDEYDFKLMIVNLQMPETNGVELIKKIRNNQQFKSIPIVVTSADSESSDLKLAVESGADDFLIKPFNEETFDKKFRNLVGPIQEWLEYPVGFDQKMSGGSYKKMVIVQSISEIGATIISDELWVSGKTYELNLNVFSNQGLSAVMAKVKSVQAIEDKFILKLLFVDVSTQSQEKIRSVCRKLWKKNRSL